MEQQVESGETYVILQPVTQQIVIDPNSRSVKVFYFLFFLSFTENLITSFQRLPAY